MGCPVSSAIPNTTVETSLEISLMTSLIASIAGTEPSVEWIHNEMSLVESSVAREISCVASGVTPSPPGHR